jgi:ribosomal protein S1
VDSVEKFGLFVEILPGKTGLLHSSELDVDRSVTPDTWSVGDMIDVKLLEVSPTWKNTPCCAQLPDNPWTAKTLNLIFNS